MKKTISINIAGQIFYIEEDGYDMLRQYLASVHRYFSAFEDSAEIVADIEGRMAERFLQKQKAENKQAISVEDVDELIKTMGSVSDFAAAEQAEDLISEPLHAAKSGTSTEDTFAEKRGKRPARRFFRDLKRKILGGVAAGIAHYYALDPLWVRLLLLLFFLGSVPINGMLGTGLEENFALLSGVLLIAYIAMWIAFPGSTTLEDNVKVKKFYRDPEHKVLGGVASGVSSYFNLDTGIVRFIWVISIFFFGTGILIYILLWAIAPAANTLTEKMEMQGEPITLSNIESNIKRNLDLGVARARDSDLKRILLLPFIIIGKILNPLGKVLRELGPVLRVLAGVFMVGLGGLGLFSLLVCGAALLGLASMPDFGILPPEFLIVKETPGVLVLSVAAFLLVPAIVILLLGLMLLLNRRVVGSTVWIVLTGLFIAGIVGMISSGMVFQRNFLDSGEYSVTTSQKLENEVLRIDQEGTSLDKSVKVRVSLQGAAVSDSIYIEKRFYAKGPNHLEARETASQLEYEVERNDSTLFFPAGPLIAEVLPYRMQEIDVAMKLPYHRPFTMTRQFYFGFLKNWNIDRNLSRLDLRNRDLDWEKLRWAFVPDSGLVCLNFPEKFLKEEKRSENAATTWERSDEFSGVALGTRGEFIKQFAVEEFSKIELGGAYHILIKKGEESTVTIDGSEANVDVLAVTVENGTLRIRKKDPAADLPRREERIGVVITLPRLESIDLSGTSLLKVGEFTGIGGLKLNLSGSTMAELNVETNKLDLNLAGVSRMIMKGRVNDLDAIVSGDCLLKAEDLQVGTADVVASGVSKVYLGQVQSLEKRESGQSKVYKNGE